MNIKVTKTETHFLLTNSLGEKINLAVDHKQKKADVSANRGGHFIFSGCEPATIERIGELIAEAGRIAGGQLLADELERQASHED